MKTQKRYATVTETTTYRIEFDAPEHTDMDELDELARAEWEKNPGRDSDDYECEIDVEPADGDDDPIAAMWMYATAMTRRD